MNLKCKYCGSPMIKDDIDYRFKGNKDIYWICDCGGGCIEQIRYGKKFRRLWSLDTGDKLIEEVEQCSH